MNKPKRANKSQRQKASMAPKAHGASKAAVTLSDADIVAALSQALQQGMASDWFEEDAVTQFAAYLDDCADPDEADAERVEQIIDLIGALSDLQISCNGGDRVARKDMQTIHELLDSALDDGSLAPGDLIMMGKILNDAGWGVSERLKTALADAMQGLAQDGPTVGDSDISSLLPDIAVDDDVTAFEIHEYLLSMTAAFSAAASGQLLAALGALPRPELHQALVGFVLHRDFEVAQAAGAALRTLAGRGPVDGVLIDRLVGMRPWLPSPRQADVDATIRVLRPHAGPPQKHEVPKVVDCDVSVCDGLGTFSIYVSQRLGSVYSLASVMMKAAGVDDVMIISGLSKSELAELQRQMRAAVPTSRSDVAGVARMLRLALADNATSGVLPPFRLVEFVEALGLTPLYAEHASPSELVEELLAGLPEAETGAAATAKAYAALLNEEFIENWYEAGEDLDQVLGQRKGFGARIRAVLTHHLPSRRQFWARQCAISALALRGQPRRSTWQHLAIAGRDLLSNQPLDEIPLMQQIATTSVQVFEAEMQ